MRGGGNYASKYGIMSVYILALIIWRAIAFFFAPYYIAICAPSGYTMFFHIISLKARFSGRKIFIEY